MRIGLKALHLTLQVLELLLVRVDRGRLLAQHLLQPAIVEETLFGEQERERPGDEDRGERRDAGVTTEAELARQIVVGRGARADRRRARIGREVGRSRVGPEQPREERPRLEVLLLPAAREPEELTHASPAERRPTPRSARRPPAPPRCAGAGCTWRCARRGRALRS